MSYEISGMLNFSAVTVIVTTCRGNAERRQVRSKDSSQMAPPIVGVCYGQRPSHTPFPLGLPMAPVMWLLASPALYIGGN